MADINDIFETRSLCIHAMGWGHSASYAWNSCKRHHSLEVASRTLSRHTDHCKLHLSKSVHFHEIVETHGVLRLPRSLGVVASLISSWRKSTGSCTRLRPQLLVPSTRHSMDTRSPANHTILSITAFQTCRDTCFNAPSHESRNLRV